VELNISVRGIPSTNILSSIELKPSLVSIDQQTVAVAEVAERSMREWANRRETYHLDVLDTRLRFREALTR